MSSAVIFEDIFVVDKLDPDGKKFDKVTRIEARSQNLDMFMHLDVNMEIYPMREGDKFTMALAHTLNLDGTPDTGYYTQQFLAHRFFLFEKYTNSAVWDKDNRLFNYVAGEGDNVPWTELDNVFLPYNINGDHWITIRIELKGRQILAYDSLKSHIRQGGRKTLADKYEYVMHGKLYKISEEGSGKAIRAYVFLINNQSGGICFIRRAVNVAEG